MSLSRGIYRLVDDISIPGTFFQAFIKNGDLYNGQLTTAEICRQALLEYNNEPNQHNRDCLSKAYDAVPKHCRIYLGGMDDKDSEYRSILDRWED
jgi:hypothetical protein